MNGTGSIKEKHETSKLQWTLLPFDVLEGVILAFKWGLTKHPNKDDWKTVNNAKDIYLNATLRHLSRYHQGEMQDKESGLNPLFHALASLMILAWHELHQYSLKPKRSKEEEDFLNYGFKK